MAELPKHYDASIVEDKWYQYWEQNDCFKSEPDDREAFTVVIPPPNVTGMLHMGHILNNTLQDVLVRRARLNGKNACWVPGMDHASIATEAKVVRRLREKGIKKSDLGRDKFLDHAWDWKEEHGGIILKQLRQLGASCDWDRTRFTMDEKYSESVFDTFIHLFEKGLIYRGLRMTNWDPQALTVLSDEEVIYTEEQSKLYHVKYKIAGSKEHLTIATTRPETILGDSAICVNPKDERYQHLVGKKAIVPMVNREIPIIADDYVDMEFGTGCLKITPAHDENDNIIGEKHNLETIEILTARGIISEGAGMFEGMDRFDAREAGAKYLEESGELVKTEEYQNKVGRSERTNAVIEPRLTKQWFVKMAPLAEPALEAVENGTINFHPIRWKNTYRHWMTNIKDWCISRQLWWGHRIPAWYYGEDENDFVVAKELDHALELAKAKSGNINLAASDLRQDEDVLDTWFSSWLWPISVFDGFYDRKELDYYFSTNDLVTGPDIIFFWVARMIMASYEFEGKPPFQNVYFTGIVRDKKGRKMSKSLGNSPDPLDLIKTYSADGVRLGMMITAPAGNDIPFDDSICEQGRNFANKIWNALRLIKGWEVKDIEQPKAASQAVIWFEQRQNLILSEIEQAFENYKISDAVMATYKLIWDDFCSWYLEAAKPGYQQPIDSQTMAATLDFFEDLMIVLHPYMPFLSEEVYHQLRERTNGDCVAKAKWPEIKTVDETVISDFEHAQKLTSEVRAIRAQKNISPKEIFQLQTETISQLKATAAFVEDLANVEISSTISDGPLQKFIVGTTEYAIPMDGLVDAEAEMEKLQSEIKRQQGFLIGVQKKLGNERFVNNAPEQVITRERQKQADAETRIATLTAQLEGLG